MIFLTVVFVFDQNIRDFLSICLAVRLSGGGAPSEGLTVSRYRSIIVGNLNYRWESVPTVDNKTGKTNAPSGQDCGALEAEMKDLKNSSHADMMPRVEIKFNISVQVIVHKLVYGFLLILWLIVSAWPS